MTVVGQAVTPKLSLPSAAEIWPRTWSQSTVCQSTDAGLTKKKKQKTFCFLSTATEMCQFQLTKRINYIFIMEQMFSVFFN